MECIKDLVEDMDWVLHHADRCADKALHHKSTCPEVGRVFSSLSEDMLKEYKQLHACAERCVEDKLRQSGGNMTEYMKGMNTAYQAIHKREMERYDKVKSKIEEYRE